MPCFFFILDTSGSMSTRSHPQFSFFDLAKNYIETFIKVRTRHDSRIAIGRENDRYFLMTTQTRYPENVKVVSEKLGGIVVDELKKLTLPYGSAQLHHTILDAFRVLHVNRAQTGIDGVGTGRAIQNTEQVVMILLTDGSGISGIPIDFRLFFDPPFLGSEMTKEAFRWDQKLYTVVFRIPSTPYRPTQSQLTTIDIDLPVIEKLCSRTSGRSFSIISTRQIQISIDYILAMASQHKVGVRFDCLPAIPGNVSPDEIARIKAKFKKVIDKKPVTNLISRLNPQGRPVSCHWPIPESYFPIRAMDQLPQRTAHPVILCAPMALPLTIRTEIPVDKLELEPSGVSDIIMEILQGRKDMTVWTYIEGSSNGPTAPFGCLRMNTMGTGITLILLPFNFPLFYPLIEEVIKDPILTTSQVWRQRLDSYFQTVPYYYFTVSFEKKPFFLKIDIPLYPPLISEAHGDTSYRNPYSSTIEDLVSKLNKIEANVEMLFNPHKTTLLDMAKLGVKPRFNTLEELHNMPQKTMGEYEAYQAARQQFYGPPMRKIDEERDRTHAFGNPYKLKGMGAGIDEVMDSAVVEGNSPQGQGGKRYGEIRQSVGGGPPKRRRGPLGIDAFDIYRTRRSMRGSSVASSEFDRRDSIDDLPGSREMTPGTSGGSTPVNEFEDLQLQEMDSDEQLQKNLDEVTEMMNKRKREESGEKVEQKVPKRLEILEPPAPPAEIISDQEIITRKIRIGSIVRKPANHRAYEEIMTLVTGITNETCSKLIKYAVRESQRFKLKQLTQKLEDRLKVI
ncbi:hypothetical protein CRE_30268 [Caenorhabditis remanei]|uniref:Integrator complex subunit 6-like beta-barrel domain-containing protein n=1 Tax=Caenorhabditis remanei TaxID=31234 RepID=E3NMR8_CAERE|nr:hypothetical protein CRE_30268 [Caenorhabditis remanei]